MSFLRSRPVVGVLTFLACLLLPLALVSAWVSGTITNSDRYVATVTPLATDPVVLDAAEEHLSRWVVDAITDRLAEMDTDSTLVGGALAASRLLEGPLRDAVSTAARAVLHSEQFARAWRAANRSAHAELISILRDGEVAVSGKRVSINLASVVNAVLESVQSSLPVEVNDVPRLEASFALANSEDLAKARTGYRILDAAGFWVPVLWVVFAALALALAASRRRTLRNLATGSLVGLALLAVLLALARHHLVNGLPADQHELAGAVWNHLLVWLRSAVRAGAVVAVLMLVVQWISGPGQRASALRSRVGSMGRG